MNRSVTQDKIYRVLEVISKSPTLSQRDLARSTGFSLGLINLTIQRLIHTGHIKVSNLDKRKVQYILTPKGLMEKTRRTYSYISKTVRTFMDYQTRLSALVDELVHKGNRQFAIVGGGEIVPLIESALGAAGGQIHYRILDTGESARPEELVLDCRLNDENGTVGISVLYRLLRDGHGIIREEDDDSRAPVSANTSL